MNNRFLGKVAAIACALCLAIGVMRSFVLAKDGDAAPPAEPVSPEATFVVLDYEGEASGAIPLPETAAPLAAGVTDNRTAVTCYVNDEAVGTCVLYGDELYVDAELFCRALGVSVNAIMIGDTYTLSGEGLYLEARTGDIYCVCNGRCILTTQGLQIRDGKAMLPVEAMAKCLGVKAAWDRVQWRVDVQAGGVQPLANGDSYYDETDLYWLSRLIFAEAGGQPMLGQLAVGSVVINRMGNASYPDQNNVYDVIFAKNQFDVVINGMIYMEPDADSVTAAKLALEGYDVVSGATVFASSEMEGLDCVAQIGDYCFMRAA